MAPTATAEETATFRSRDQNLRLVREPASEQIDSRGVRLPRPGKSVEFRNGQFATSDADELEFLRNHHMLNVDGGFFEVGNEPDRPKPEADDVIAAMFEAGFEKDADEVRTLIRLEYASHSRPSVINAGRSVLKQLGEDPDEGTKPPAGPVDQNTVDAIAKQLQARLDEHGKLTPPESDATDVGPGEPPPAEGEPVPGVPREGDES
jgi:hypothetical protein